MPSPFDFPDLYSCIVLGGMKSPGVVTITGHDRKIGWDVKKGPGQSGASTTRTSEDPVEFTCSFYLVRDASRGVDDFERWDEFATLVYSTIAGQTPKALDIYHPNLAENDIKSVVLSSFGGAVHDGKGGVTYAIKFLEYRPAKSKGGSPNGSSTKGNTKTKIAPDDPNAEALAELARLTAQYNATPWG